MSFLSDIIEVKKEEAKLLRRDYSFSRFRDAEYSGSKGLSFSDALNRKDSVSIIAEIKKASPSKGVLLNNFNHLRIADTYFENSVDAVSILTDKIFFKGSIEYLSDNARIKTVPLLRKDFIIDEYQIYETKSYGADAVLLISEILSENQIKEFTLCAKETDLDVLLELHSIESIDKIDLSINTIIGINNRNLETFETNIETTKIISGLLPKDILRVSESGIKSRNDFDLLKSQGINAVLIGEYLMAAPNIPDRIKELKEWSRFEN